VRRQTGFVRFEGRRIAYATTGDGPPLVMPAWWVSHLLEDWEGTAFRRFVEALATRHRVVRYDRLGTGLSERDRPPETLTLGYELGALEALLDELEIERAAHLGLSCGGSLTAAYAARHPARVERIVLFGAYPYGRELARPDARAAMTELVRSAWGLGSRMLADLFGPTLARADRDAFASSQRASATPEMAADLLDLTYAYDVRDVLPLLTAPTLIVHREHDRAVPLKHGRAMAALVPDAELVVVPGDAHLPWQGDADPVLAAIAPFLGMPAHRSPAPARRVEELSAREREVLRLVAEGLSDAEIGARLVLSPHTVHRHVANIRRKLGLRSRSAAAAAAARAGII
jgi:pimeloyl-ACP methyl ester carboxylesterase/DNA-binding CsgD family transcriptional regulator